MFVSPSIFFREIHKEATDQAVNVDEDIVVLGITARTGMTPLQREELKWLSPTESKWILVAYLCVSDRRCRFSAPRRC
jgi:hypothetical protein